VKHPDWTYRTNLYCVNVRQYSAEGTLAAFARHLPRLHAMGVETLWFMPLQPIGVLHRKGSLGSYYAIRDYGAVNPEFGSLTDFKGVVALAQALGMKVLLDWVANHTAWDHAWTGEHPDWYKKDAAGQIYPVTFSNGPEPEYWTDVVALDYAQPDLWRGMIDAMAWWLRETGIDGFRCDVAGLVPLPFWQQARRELDAIKPVFMLAEWSEPELHDLAFDMTYGWDLTDVLRRVGAGQAGADALRAWVAQPSPKAYPAHAYRLRFTSNHDINSWHGHDGELYGPAFAAMAVLAATLPGLPLIYGGQESGLDQRLAFFEKDAIDWRSYQHQALYTELLALKKAHPALGNGEHGAPAEVIEVGNDAVFSFRRLLGAQAGGAQGVDRVAVVVNVTHQAQTITLPGSATPRELPAWGWLIDASDPTVDDRDRPALHVSATRP
jgi:glycosidase